MKPLLKNQKLLHYKTQLFICTNPSGCALIGGQKLRDSVKKKLIQYLGIEKFKENVRINNSGCLGECKEGIAACFQPQNVMWINLKTEDDDNLIHEVLQILKM